MNQEVEEAVSALREHLERSTADERLELMKVVTQGYCTHCGNKDPDNTCQCWNDD